MNCVRAPRRLAAAFLAAAAVVSPSSAQQPSHDLRGVWRLVSITDSGRNVPMNALMFLSATYYGRITVEKNRPKFETGIDFRKPETLTPEQQRFVSMLFPRSNSNGGTYRVAGDTFHFTAIAHQNPNAEGQEFRRRIRRDGKRLRLIQESDRKAEEVWKRVEEFR
jgi:hypothetical protein